MVSCTPLHCREGAATGAPRRLIGAFGEVLITVGVLLWLFVWWQLWWTDVTANRDQASTNQALERGLGEGRHGGVADKGPLATRKNVPFGEAFAILRIPRFGADFARPVLEGTDHDTLTNGLGHYEGTAMPGLVANFAVAAQRTTYGRQLHDIDLLPSGELIVVETKANYVVYAVVRHVTVTPGQVEVIAPVPQRPGVQPTSAWMTTTPCRPKYSPSRRSVVFARLVRVIPPADGLPASVMAVPAGAVA